jgi:RNA polymerase-binding transcription factor DksA
VDTAQARMRLEELRSELTGSIATMLRQNEGGNDELSTYDQHPGETNLADTDREVALVEHQNGQLEQVIAALARLDDGAYGVCLRCGRTIPDARLEARPEAAYDIECQAIMEAQG